MNYKLSNNNNDNLRSKSSGGPSPTLYVQNLDDKLKKTDLKRLLYQIFLSYGKVIDVVVKKGKMRGQAFVVFSDLQGSTQAMRYLDGTSFLGKNLKITYSSSRSFATIRQLAGEEILYQVKLGLKDPQTLKDIDPKYSSNKLTVSGAQAANIEKRKADEAAATKKRLREEEGGDGKGSSSSQESEDDDDQERSNGVNKKSKSNHNTNNQEEEEDVEEAMEEDSDEEQVADSAAAAAVKAAGSAPIQSGEDPNPVLFLEGLPSEVTDDMMAVLFQQYPGFQSVRMVPGRTGIAFVQFDTSTQSGMAKTALDGFNLAPGIVMKVGFARRS